MDGAGRIRFRPSQWAAAAVIRLLATGLRLRLLTAASLFALVLGSLGAWTRPGDARLAVSEPSNAVTIWVADNGFHTDLIVPRAPLARGDGPLATALRQVGPGDWIAVGWGDARFYTDVRPISDRLADGGRALLKPGNPSVILIDPLNVPPPDVYPRESLHVVTVSQSGLEGLRHRLEASFKTRAGAPIAGPASEVGDGRFFESVETFWVGHLCNHWAGELLHASGVSVRPFRTIFSAEIVRMAHSTSETSGSPDRADETSGHDA